MKYLVIDNKSGIHTIEAENDSHVLEILKTRYIDYIVSILSSDSIVVVRPNGYILAYIDTATGEQTVKSMSDWGISC